MGILSLKLESKIVNGEKFIHGVPFVVPGGRFNEMCLFNLIQTAGTLTLKLLVC